MKISCQLQNLRYFIIVHLALLVYHTLAVNDLFTMAIQIGCNGWMIQMAK